MGAASGRTEAMWIGPDLLEGQCPYCGGAARVHRSTHGAHHGVDECNGCRGSIDWYEEDGRAFLCGGWDQTPDGACQWLLCDQLRSRFDKAAKEVCPNLWRALVAVITRLPRKDLEYLKGLNLFILYAGFYRDTSSALVLPVTVACNDSNRVGQGHLTRHWFVTFRATIEEEGTHPDRVAEVAHELGHVVLLHGTECPRLTCEERDLRACEWTARAGFGGETVAWVRANPDRLRLCFERLDDLQAMEADP